MFLVLIKGSARKSDYMKLLHKGTNNSLMVQYGTDVPILLPRGKECWVYHRSEASKTDIFDLESDLNELMAQILNTNYRYIYLYGNFEPHETEALHNVASKVDGQLVIIATVQDTSVPNGQIIIEEIR